MIAMPSSVIARAGRPASTAAQRHLADRTSAVTSVLRYIDGNSVTDCAAVSVPARDTAWMAFRARTTFRGTRPRAAAPASTGKTVTAAAAPQVGTTTSRSRLGRLRPMLLASCTVKDTQHRARRSRAAQSGTIHAVALRRSRTTCAAASGPVVAGSTV
jgi:hypothetical protein